MREDADSTTPLSIRGNMRRRLSDSIKRLSKNLGFAKDEVPETKEDAVEAGEVADDFGDEEPELDLARLQESESESEIEPEPKNPQGESEDEDEDDEEDEEDEEDEDVPLSDAELDDDADVVTYQKTTINNHRALKNSLESIQLGKAAQGDFFEHLTITSGDKIELRDIYDDTERELSFYKQALAAANESRDRFKKLKIPFARPVDYFAEMVKSDEHMDKLKQRLISDETAKKASQEARRQRELKKFGKKVQHAQLQQRHKDKRETLDKIKNLKRKRGSDDMSSEQFDVEVEEALRDKKKERQDKYKLGNTKRDAKNKKYGSGGKKRGMKNNTAESSMDLSAFGNSNNKRKNRPGKSRRK